MKYVNRFIGCQKNLYKTLVQSPKNTFASRRRYLLRGNGEARSRDDEEGKMGGRWRGKREKTTRGAFSFRGPIQEGFQLSWSAKEAARQATKPGQIPQVQCYQAKSTTINKA
jgi:hypothetical protein